MCFGFEVPEPHRAQFGEFRKGPKVPEFGVVERCQEFADVGGRNRVGVVSDSGPQTAVNRHVGLAPTSEKRSRGSGVEFGHALQDRMKQFYGRPHTAESGVGVNEPPVRYVPVVYGNLRRHEIHPKRRRHWWPVVLGAAIDAAGDVETAVDCGHQGACHGMEKGGVGYLVEADVYAVLPKIESEAGAGQIYR